MSDAAPAPQEPSGDAAPPEVSETVSGLAEDDLVIVNEDGRTWEVTDVVDQDLDADDSREGKRVVRLEASQQQFVWGLVFEQYPDHAECHIHVLETEYWYEADKVYPVEQIRVLDTHIPWVVTKRGGTDVYHRPDPLSMADGEAHPVCNLPRDPENDYDYNIQPFQNVYPAKRACMECFRRNRPRRGKAVCPECGHRVAGVVVQGSAPAAITAVTVTCPAESCDYEGVVSLAE